MSIPAIVTLGFDGSGIPAVATLGFDGEGLSTLGDILLEDGFSLLLEDGGHLLLEGGPALSDPGSMLAAIHAAYADAGLPGSAGPLYSLKADRGRVVPHVVVKVRTAGPDLETSSGQRDDVRVSFECRGTTTAEARAIARLVDAWALDGSTTGGQVGLGRRFAWDGGRSGPACRVDWSKEGESGNAPRAAGPAGPVYVDKLKYRFSVRGSR